MKKYFLGMTKVAISICLMMLLFICDNIPVFATGAGIQLGTDIEEEVIPQGEGQTTYGTESEQVQGPNTVDEAAGEQVQETVTADGTESGQSQEIANTDNSVEAASETSLAVESKVAFIEVQNYSVEGGLLEAGSDLTVNIILHNISSTVKAESLVITMSSSSGMIYPRYGSDNQIFAGTILPDESKVISIPITVSSEFKGDAADFICQFDYLSENSTMSNSSTMIITTSTGRSLIVKGIDVGGNAILNGKSLLSVNYVNTSNLNITDAKLIIEGNVSDDSKIIDLDTVYAGKSYSKDCKVTFVSGGNQEINVKLSYTDISGEKVETDLGTYSVIVSEEEITSDKSNASNKVLFWGGRMLAAIAFVAAIALGFNYFKKNNI
ncbi:hypothetical protein [Butyrivibrio sp. AC2005]|uniref:hypothetical protein n=1 Tax=Butyrivibrio sp. AC2005 TaxID=1280672 RepID=UPI00047C5AFE|nr:hypothetical protein [Butyrivibrio sp. AC2005]